MAPSTRALSRGADRLVLRGGAGRNRLAFQQERVQALGARRLLDRDDDPDEPLPVRPDPAGHPFCLFVAPTQG